MKSPPNTHTGSLHFGRDAPERCCGGHQQGQHLRAGAAAGAGAADMRHLLRQIAVQPESAGCQRPRLAFLCSCQSRHSQSAQSVELVHHTVTEGPQEPCWQPARQTEGVAERRQSSSQHRKLMQLDRVAHDRLRGVQRLLCPHDSCMMLHACAMCAYHTPWSEGSL